MTVLETMAAEALFGRHFAGEAWEAWRAFLAACFGLPMSEAQRALYKAHTGRETPPAGPAREAWVIVGRRGGKSFIAALVAVFLACFRDYRELLAPGEVGTLPVIAADRKQARHVMRYIVGLLEGSLLLAKLIVQRTAESIELANRVTIEVHTASWRSIRGYTVVAAVLDEVAFWRSEDSANPDREIVNALRPAMATVPGSLLLAISSPYARRGVLWDAYRRHFGQESDVLVWQAPTRAMNPSVPQAIVDNALAEDEPAARAEYLAEFRRDVETYVPREAVEACTVPGRYGLPPVSGVQYVAFCDPSGGSADAFTLAIAHREERHGTPIAVLDYLAERRPPFSPEAVVEEFTAALKLYRCRTVTGDRYGGEWPREAFRRHGVEYQVAGKPRNDLYVVLLPLISSGRVELLDHRGLATQLVSLERRTARGGRDTIDHPPNGHDDVSNAVAGAVVAVIEGATGPGMGLLGFLRDEVSRMARNEPNSMDAPA